MCASERIGRVQTLGAYNLFDDPELNRVVPHMITDDPDIISSLENNQRRAQAL